MAPTGAHRIIMKWGAILPISSNLASSSRNNPLTPSRNFELTEALGAYHASELDEIGSLYYSKESFDDFYYGKGSTYPDVNGTIGILFEHASSRALERESSFGNLHI